MKLLGILNNVAKHLNNNCSLTVNTLVVVLPK